MPEVELFACGQNVTTKWLKAVDATVMWCEPGIYARAHDSMQENQADGRIQHVPHYEFNCFTGDNGSVCWVTARIIIVSKITTVTIPHMESTWRERGQMPFLRPWKWWRHNYALLLQNTISSSLVPSTLVLNTLIFSLKLSQNHTKKKLLSSAREKTDDLIFHLY